MNMSSLYQIHDSLRKTGIYVFTIKDIGMIGRIESSTAWVYTNRMLEKGMLKRIEKGKYSIGDDPFIIASQLIFPSYISFLPALYMHGLTEQTVSRILVASPKRKKPINVFGNNVVFVHLPPSMMFGYGKVKKENSIIMLADPEKAVVDILYKPEFGPISYIADLIKQLDAKKLENYALNTGSEAVIRRTGFLMDLAGLQHSLKCSSYNSYKLNPRVRRKGKFDNKWKLYINEVL